MHNIVEHWKNAKAKEKAWQEERRRLEDKLIEMYAVNPQEEGTVDAGEFKIITRLNRKVNQQILEDIVHEKGLEEVVSTLFRFKPELNLTAWKQADESITTPFLDAITTTASRPTFKLKEAK